MVRRKRTVATGMALLLLMLAVLGGSASGDTPLEDQILQRVASDQGIPLDRLEIGALDPVAVTPSGVNLYQAKVIDTATGEVHGLVVDATAEIHSLEDAKAAQREAYEARYGRLHPDLADLLETMAGDEMLTVAVWLQAGEVTAPSRPEMDHQPAAIEQGDAQVPPPGPKTSVPAEEQADAGDSQASAARVAAIKAEEAARRAEIEAAQEASLAHLATQVAAVEAPLLADLAAQGVEPTYVSPYAPLIYVTLPKSEILSLAQRDDVDRVYGPHDNADLMSSAKPTQKANVVDAWGFDGSGIDVAILEDSRVQFNNPYLNAGTTRVPGDGNVDQHATATAGMVASQHSTHQGIAQGAYIYSANATDYGDANLSAAMDWAVNQGVDIINNSWGEDDGTLNLNEHDRHLDYIVRNYARTVTVSAGNNGSGTGHVGSPARAYNVISVGNYQDHDTLTWADDDMRPSSSYIDPSTGVEKPEVAASGSSIDSTTHLSPWIGNVGSGTSYSAPMVAGEAAMLMERDSTLTRLPEAVKAIVMASALHNIEGDSRLSEYDGAGGVDMRAAFRIVDEGWWDSRTVSSSSFPYNIYIYAFAGETVRAAIAWNSNPNATYTSDPLNADIDLRVYAPNGSLAASSTSAPNSYEIVEFTASATGNYRMEVDDFRFDGTSEYMGAAWWPGHRVLTAYTPQTLGTPPTSHDYYRFDAASDWNAVGIRVPSGGFYPLDLYASSPFANPADYDRLEDSSLSTTVEYVVLDRNHAPSGSRYPEPWVFSGSGNYTTEWATRSTWVYNGTYGPYSMSPSQVIRVWDADLDAGVRKYFAIKPVSGNADLGMSLHDTDPASSASWYQGRSQYVAYADSAGAGGDEYMNYQASVTDWMGFVVWNNGATSSTSFYLYADTTAPTGSISINGGAAYANSTSVTLNLSASDAQTGVSEMRFANIGGSWSSWEPYASSKSWTLPTGDGLKWVYAQFRNNANMVSTAYADSITLDTVAPTGSIVINGGAAYATSTSVSLSLSANDGLSGVAEMRVGNSGGLWGPWEAYSTSKSWTLISGDGTRAVYVQYRDHAGNVSTNYSDSIILDTTPPAGSILINGGAAYATSTSVALTLSASDATSGVAEMRVGNSGGLWGPWEAYTTGKSWTLISGDGTKAVYVQYRDNAGNGSGSYSDSITLDTVAPVGSILIDGGASYATSTSVALTLSASDATSGLDAMRFSNNGTSWSSWEPYGTSKSWTLLSGDGTKPVYVQYRDHAGHLSGLFSDGIVLDTAAPAGSILIDGGATYATSTSVALTLSASDATSGVAEMRFSYDGNAWMGWELYATSRSWTLAAGDGTQPVYVQYRDHAGNISAPFSDTIALDTTPPTGSIQIDGGATYANSTSVTLDLSASDATSGLADMRFSNNGSTWGNWEPYAPSKSWSLASADGTRTVYVQYRDNVAHISSSFSDSIVLDRVAPAGSVLIDGGATYASSTSVTLDLSASDATSGLDQMRFSNNGSTWSSWEQYAASKSWLLDSGDGAKTVYVQYLDNAGNGSISYSDTILLDTVAPAGLLLIDSGATYATSTSVLLTLSASDGLSGVDEMRFSNNGSTWSGWEAYATSKSWTLASGDGSKTVYVQYRDNAGNVSTSFSDTIILDSVAPSGSILIDGGAVYATSTSVTLDLSASDATSGLDQMRFSNNGSTWSNWEAYATSKSWTLDSGDGSKTVYVQYRDHAANVSASFSDSIILDTVAPTGSIQIEAGASYANSTSVALNLSASDAGSGVADMRFSNNGSTWVSWEPYATSKSWMLDTGDGIKTVYVQYRDDVGLISASLSDSITLDTFAPTSSATSPASSLSLSFSVSWSGSDGLSGIASYDVQYREGSIGAWTDWLVGTTDTSATFGPSSPVLVQRDRTYYFRVRARDNAGNLEVYPGGDGDTSTYVEESFPVYLPVVLKSY